MLKRNELKYTYILRFNFIADASDIYTVNGELCFFPFIYGGKIYDQCAHLRADLTGPVCGIQPSIRDANNLFECKIPTFGGTAPEGSQCSFPFEKEQLINALTQSHDSTYEDTWREVLEGYYEYDHASPFHECAPFGSCDVCVVRGSGQNIGGTASPLWGFCYSANMEEATMDHCIGKIVCDGI